MKLRALLFQATVMVGCGWAALELMPHRPAASPSVPAAVKPPATSPGPIQSGEALYKANCAACHQSNGEGLPPNFPALTDSAVIRKGPTVVRYLITNGRNLMPPFRHLTEEERLVIAQYVVTRFGSP